MSSALVIDAKTEEQHHRELHDAILRLWAGDVGLPTRPIRLAAPLVTGRHNTTP
jgi:hypothetical protein